MDLHGSIAQPPLQKRFVKDFTECSMSQVCAEGRGGEGERGRGGEEERRRGGEEERRRGGEEEKGRGGEEERRRGGERESVPLTGERIICIIRVNYHNEQVYYR